MGGAERGVGVGGLSSPVHGTAVPEVWPVPRGGREGGREKWKDKRKREEGGGYGGLKSGKEREWVGVECVCQWQNSSPLIHLLTCLQADGLPPLRVQQQVHHQLGEGLGVQRGQLLPALVPQGGEDGVDREKGYGALELLSGQPD